MERENFIDVSAREDYVRKHPESAYCLNIKNGEIIRGMNGEEVIASWGLPNVYLVSSRKAEEYWIYYVEDDISSSVLIYTLTFDQENALDGWAIDMKRYIDHSFVLNPATQAGDRKIDRSPIKR